MLLIMGTEHSAQTFNVVLCLSCGAEDFCSRAVDDCNVAHILFSWRRPVML